MNNSRCKWTLLALTGAVAFSISFVSELRAETHQRFDEQVRADFFAGFTGDTDALARGLEKCEAILKQNPKHAEAMVWHGTGVYSLAARSFQNGDMQKGMQQYKQSLQEMSDAVKLEPDNIGVLAPRGGALLTGSHFFPENLARPQIETGLADYAHIYDLQQAYFNELGQHPRGELLFGLAEGWSRMGNGDKARAYFLRIQDELPGSPYAARAKTWLEKGSLPTDQTRCIGCHVK